MRICDFGVTLDSDTTIRLHIFILVRFEVKLNRRVIKIVDGFASLPLKTVISDSTIIDKARPENMGQHFVRADQRTFHAGEDVVSEVTILDGETQDLLIRRFRCCQV